MINTNDSGPGSLRYAIACAEAKPGTDTVDFAIPGAGPHTIQPLSALPTIQNPIIIDATTQPGYSGMPVIELDGSLAGAAASGLWLRGGSSTVKGLAINRFSANGITLSFQGGNTVEDNLIGTDITGTLDQGNAGRGIEIAQVPNNIIRNNVISGNTLQGVYLVGVNGTNNQIVRNLIGTDVTGAAPLGNGNFGVYLGGPSNLVQDNVISGNGVSGVFITSASGNVVNQNLIGLNLAGDAAIGNASYGVDIRSSGNTIGGTDDDDGNVISGNVLGGILLSGAAATGNLLAGNYIGTDLAGMADLGNLGRGVTISLGSGNTIGGIGDAGNLVSGNDLQGIYIAGANNIIQGNVIGLNADGTAALPNTNFGVYLAGSSNQLGGADPGEGNVISGNARGGVLIDAAGSTGNVVEGNRIGTNAAGDAALGNTGYGVDVRRAGNTIGGSAVGAGNVISGNTAGGLQLVSTNAQSIMVEGNRIGTNLAGDDALPNGGAGVTLASASNNTLKGNVISGNTAQGVLVGGIAPTGNVIVGNMIGTNAEGTAALGNGNVGVYVGWGGNFVGGTNPGDGNLISGNAVSGVYIINAMLPGSTVQGNRIGTDVTGTLKVGNGSFGVDVRGPGNTIGGAAAGAGNQISGNGGGGVQINGAAATGNFVQGNLIGTASDGAAALGNNQQGVLIIGGTSNAIGGTAAGAGNVISANRRGIMITGATATGNAIQGNSIFQNIAQGIDLSGDNFTANDVDDPDAGPNNLQNFPVITAATLSGGTLTITYAVPSVAPNSDFPIAVEFFRADVDHQEGRFLLGGASYASPGAKVVAIPAGGAVVGQRIVATATDLDGNTSEFSSPAFVITAALMAPAAAEGEAVDLLTDAQLQPVVTQAIAVWQAAGLDAARVAALQSLSVTVADLPGAYLGWATADTITIDADAAGYGWQTGSPAAESYDLLSAVLHEMGHVLGLDHDEDGLMADVLLAGQQKLPGLADIDEVLAQESWLE